MISPTVAEQSETFLQWMATRRRNPAKPATIRMYSSWTRNWISPTIGTQSLEGFGSKSMKDFVDVLVGKSLSPSTVKNIVILVKQIVLSALNEDGQPRFPKIWNNTFIDLPPMGKQSQPVVSVDGLQAAMRDERYSKFYAMLAGTGLRIGEALAVRFGEDGLHTAWNPDRAVISVRTSIWQGKEQAPKTTTAVREIDLHPKLNNMLCTLKLGVAGIGQLLFATNTGKPLWESRVRTDSLGPLGIHGFHSFRRFRITQLREVGVPEDILRYWVGHTGAAITDRYSKMAENVALRRQWATRAGLGFEVPKESE